MLNRPIASQSLEQYSNYMLNKMWLKGEIAKCPVCHRYHDLNLKDAKFLYNMSKCDECKAKELKDRDNGMDIINEWLKENI